MTGNLVRIRYLFEDRITGAWGNDPNDDYGVVCIRAADFETDKLRHLTEALTRREYSEADFKKKQLKKGDIIIEKSGGGDKQPVGRVIVFDLKEPALCSNFLAILRPNKEKLNFKFGAYLLYSLWFSRVVEQHIKQTTGIQNLDTQSYFDQNVKLPDLSEQELIVEYLDLETEQINWLLAEKERMLALLEEKRAALIRRAVTRGLDLDAPLKPSGHPWLGEIPAHWKVKRSKQVLKERDERSVTGDEELLTVSHITGVTKRSEKEVYMFEAETTEGYKRCSPGNLVINTLWAWMGAMGIAWEAGIVSPAYHVYELSPEFLPGYVDALVRMPVFAKEVTRFSKGVWSSRLRLYPEGLYEVRLPVPPLEEQQQIIDSIVREREQTAEMEAALSKSIELLKERRSALITAAVTGRIEIPEISPEKEVRYAH